MSKNIHVVPHGNRWAVKPAGKPYASTHRTQELARQSAVPLARHNRSEVVIHKPNGIIRDSDSYGSDKYPPKG